MISIYFIISLCIYKTVVANIQLTEEQYYKFPRLFHLDDYDECLSQRDGVYCLGSFDLLPADNKSLYNVIKEYSEEFLNYNHTRIHRGFCVSSRCPELKNSSDVEVNFQKCVYKWTRNQNGLTPKLYLLDYCKNSSLLSEKSVRNEDIDWFNVIVKCIVVLNLIGTVYDVFRTDNKGHPLLLTWSLKSNWKLLTESNIDDEKNVFQPLQLIRLSAVLFIIFGHVILTMIRSYIQNPFYVEFVAQQYYAMLFHNGSALAQVFTLLSSFFLAYKILEECDKYPNRHMGLGRLPKLILKRLTRLLPLYWFIFYFSMTWWSKLADGPMWYLVNKEVASCVQNPLPHFLMFVNLVDAHNRCLPHTWSLKVDLQLYVISASLCLILARKKYALKILISLLCGSILTVFGISYITGFKCILSISTPEIMRTVYLTDSMSYLYMSLWGSAPTCFLGLVLAHIIFDYQKRTAAKYKKDDVKSNKHNDDPKIPVILIMVPGSLMGAAWILTGHWAKSNTSHLASSIYTAMERPVLMVITCCIIFLSVTKSDRKYNYTLWRGWTIPSRLSFSVMLVHWLINLSFVASYTHTTHFSGLNILENFVLVLFGSFVLSVPCTLMIEMPAQRFLQKLFNV